MEHNLFTAIWKLDLSSFYQLLEELDDINIVDEDGRNLLMLAIVEKNSLMAEALLNRGIDVDHQDKAGYTALHFSALYQELGITESIIGKGANVNLVDEHGNNPLWTAVFNSKKDYRIVEILMKAGANPHSKNHVEKSPLNLATRFNSTELLKIMNRDNPC